jgi:hypothetical protein
VLVHHNEHGILFLSNESEFPLHDTTPLQWRQNASIPTSATDRGVFQTDQQSRCTSIHNNLAQNSGRDKSSSIAGKISIPMQWPRQILMILQGPFLGCLMAFFLVAAQREPERTSGKDPTLSEWKGVGRTMSADEVKRRLGPPSRVARQILFRRHLEQWTYATPPICIELDCVRGQEMQVVSVHSLRSGKQ